MKVEDLIVSAEEVRTRKRLIGYVCKRENFGF